MLVYLFRFVDREVVVLYVCCYVTLKHIKSLLTVSRMHTVSSSLHIKSGGVVL